MDKFVNLHVHSDGSIGDSVIRVPKLIDKIQDYQQQYVALTDHASVMNHYLLRSTCQDTNIKPLYGNELYCKIGYDKPQDRNRFHLVLIAQNEQGLNNINKIQRISVADHHYYKPLTPFELVFDNTEGIFCSTACALSYINYQLLNNNDDEAYSFFNKLLDNFGRDNVAIELQYHPSWKDKELHNYPQNFLNNKLIELYDNTDAKYIINTFDSHFIDEQDREIRKKIQSIAWKKPENEISDSLKSNCIGNSSLCYQFGHESGVSDDIIQLCIDNTYKIAEQCYFLPKNYGPIVPKFTFHREFKKIFCQEW